MVTAKTDERRQVLAERHLNVIEAALTAILREFGLDPGRQSVRQAFARQLTEVGRGNRLGVPPLSAPNTQRSPKPVAF